jgi:hypothetical protein
MCLVVLRPSIVSVVFALVVDGSQRHQMNDQKQESINRSGEMSLLQPKVIKRELYDPKSMSLYKASYLLRFRSQLFRELIGYDNRSHLYLADMNGATKGQALSAWEGWTHEQVVRWLNDNVG